MGQLLWLAEEGGVGGGKGCVVAVLDKSIPVVDERVTVVVVAFALFVVTIALFICRSSPAFKRN